MATLMDEINKNADFTKFKDAIGMKGSDMIDYPSVGYNVKNGGKVSYLKKHVNDFQKSTLNLDNGYGYQDPVFLGFYLDFHLNSPLFSLNYNEPESTAYFLKNVMKDDELVSNHYKFVNLLTKINDEMPWYWQSITGLADAWRIDRGEAFRAKDVNITINTLESVNLITTMLGTLYIAFTFDQDGMYEIIPYNLRRFDLDVYLTELRFIDDTNTSKNTVGKEPINGRMTKKDANHKVISYDTSFVKIHLQYCEMFFNQMSIMSETFSSVLQNTPNSNSFLITPKRVLNSGYFNLFDYNDNNRLIGYNANSSYENTPKIPNVKIETNQSTLLNSNSESKSKELETKLYDKLGGPALKSIATEKLIDTLNKTDYASLIDTYNKRLGNVYGNTTVGAIGKILGTDYTNPNIIVQNTMSMGEDLYSELNPTSNTNASNIGKKLLFEPDNTYRINLKNKLEEGEVFKYDTNLDDKLEDGEVFKYHKFIRNVYSSIENDIEEITKPTNNSKN